MFLESFKSLNILNVLNVLKLLKLLMKSFLFFIKTLIIYYN